MPSDRKKLPGALLLVLSALGILISWLFAAYIFFGLVILPKSASSSVDQLTLASVAALAFLIGILHFPAFVLSFKSLRGKATPVKHDSLFKGALMAGFGWLIIVVMGYFAFSVQVSQFVFVPLTLLASAIPVWWLVEFSRRRLPRSTAMREWGAITFGLSITPFLIMALELIVLVVLTLGVMLILRGQPAFMQQFGNLIRNLDLSKGGMAQLDKLLAELSRNPVIAAALFLGVGIIAPIIEEFFKPMALWFLLNRPLKEYEGFSLGLISGGVFALLESGGLISQVGPDSWVQAVVLRAGTGLLHVGLSGLMGYGLVYCWNRKKYGCSLLFLLSSAGLHSAWNTFALMSDTSALVAPSSGTGQFQVTLASVLPVVGMAAVFGAVVFIVLRINKKLRLSLASPPETGINAPSEI
jgi:membrane protease YdiL (CAAX protease family)